MTRDIRFEIDYILSLTVASLGFLSISGIKEYFDERLGFLFLGILSLHLLLFNANYVFSKVLSFDFNVLSNFEKSSRYSLYAISIFFSYIFSHLIVSAIYNNFTATCPSSQQSTIYQLLCQDFLEIMFGFQNFLGEKFILYAIPALGVLLFMSPLLAVIPSMRFFNDVEVVVSPETIEITDNFEDTKQLSVSILNNSDRTLEFKTIIDPPVNVDLRYDGEVIEGRLEESTKLSKTNPGKRINVELRYTGDERLTTKVPVQIEHKYTSKKYAVTAELYP